MGRIKQSRAEIAKETMGTPSRKEFMVEAILEGLTGFLGLGAVAPISKKKALSGLVSFLKSPKGKRMRPRHPLNKAEYLKTQGGILRNIKRMPQEVLDNVDDIRYDPRLMGRSRAIFDTQPSKTIKLNPEFLTANPSSVIHEGVHSTHRTAKGFGNKTRAHAERIVNYTADETYRQGKKDKLYHKLPSEIMARDVAKKLDKSGGLISMEDYIQAYDTELIKTLKAMKKTAPKMFEKAWHKTK
jgi:hypothetical protein